MALFSSPVIAAASGSVGGMTYSRNRYGAYLRSRVVPVDPASDLQVAARLVLAGLVQRWTETLTQAQRDAWASYAANVPVINRIGATVFLTGQQWYVGANRTRDLAALGYVDDGPEVFDRGSFLMPVGTVDASDGEVSVAFDNADPPYNQTGAALLVFASRPMNASRQFFKGPYRYAGAVLGNGAVPPTSPTEIALPFAVAAGNKVGLRYVACFADGRYTSSFQDVAVAVA